MDLTETSSLFHRDSLIENVLLKALNSAQRILDAKTTQILRTELQGYSSDNQNLEQVIQFFLFTMMNQIENMKQIVELYGRQGWKEVKLSDYSNLEGALQKSEEEVRKHIRIEQQLKIYMDGLQEKNENLIKEIELQKNKYEMLFQSARQLDNDKKQLIKKIKNLQTRLKQQQKIISHKGSKVMSEASIYQTKNGYRSSLEKHHHKKVKLFDKSNDKPHKLQTKGQLKFINESINLGTKEDNKRLMTEVEVKEYNKTIEINEGKRPLRRIMKKTEDDRSLIIGRKNVRCISVIK